jgi:hypothetical protein
MDRVELQQCVGTFTVCVLLHMCIPLLPLLIELGLTETISTPSLTIGATIYTINIGLSSRSRVLFAITLVASILLSAAYGFVVVHNHPLTDAAGNVAVMREQLISNRLRVYSAWVIFGVFALHVLERFNRHVLKKEPFWNFEEVKK